ncbi:MAG: porin family protein [Cyclobacteriaceae bacterium]
MKKFSLILLALALANIAAQAQDQIGIKGGINFANYGGDVIDNKVKPGIHLGAFLNFRIIDELYVQPELLYSLQGSHFKRSEVSLDYKEHLHYINLPILARYYLTENISVHAGPYFGVLISGKAKGNWYGTEINQNIDQVRSLKSFDFGLVAGIAYQLANRLNIGARLNLGVLNLSKNDNPVGGGGDGFEYEYNYDSNLTNRVIQVYVAMPLKN